MEAIATPVLKKVVIKKVVTTPTTTTPPTSDVKKVTKKATEAKKKAVPKVVKTTETKKKRVTKKLEYPKEGQTKPTPPEQDSLRKFYTSLMSQNPKSEMAKTWCIEHGLFPGQPDNISISLANLSIK